MIELAARLFNLDRIDRPYHDMWEYYQDYARLINLKLLFALVGEQKTGKEEAAGYEMFESVNSFLRLLTKDLSIFESQYAAEEYIEDIRLCEQYLQSRRTISAEEGRNLPDIYLSEVFGLNPFEHECVMLSFIACLDAKYEKVFAFFHDTSSRKYPTVETALRLFSGKDGKPHDNLRFLMPDSKLFQFFFQVKSQDGSSLLSQPLILQKRMMHFLTSTPFEESGSMPTWTIVDSGDKPEKLVTNSDIADIIENIPFLQSTRYPGKTAFINLYGAAGSGRKLLFRHFCRRLETTGMIIDCDRLPPEKDKFNQKLLDICREAILLRSLIFLDNADILYGAKEGTEKIQIVLSVLSGHISMVFAASEKEIPSNLIPVEINHHSIEVPSPDIDSRIRLWNWFSKDKKLDRSVNITELANKFTFSPGQIKNSLERAIYESELKGLNHIGVDILYNSCYRQIVHNLAETATLIKPAYSWDDLVLSEAETNTLRAACNHVKYRHRVFGEWGFEKKLPYGRGLAILFSGPPGTGKTMSAQIIANELHMEMYKIQISKIISKYIGETEKNLRVIFEEANKSNVILFFDETDALFGKRSEVKDSHDRYANIEVAYLLQQIEEHDGITIMSTNYMKNIDEAFLRRINYIIHYPFPDAKARQRIWEKVFPERTPVSRDVDFGFLAEKFEISGGNIKNIAVSSAFQAASENSEITMNHIIRAAIHEQKKNNKVIVAEDLEEYADLL